MHAVRGEVVKLTLAMCRRICERAGADWSIRRMPKRNAWGITRASKRGPDFVALHCRGHRVPMVPIDEDFETARQYYEAFTPYHFKRRFEEFCAREPELRREFIIVAGYEPRDRIETFERSEVALCHC